MSFSSKKHNPLDKRIPENPRYQHIKAVVDSGIGASMNKYHERLEEIRRNYKFRKDEIFRRIKCPTFVQLVLQIASVGIDEGQLLEECPIHTRIETTPATLPHPSPPLTPRSTLSDLVSGMGELDMSGSTPSSTPNQSPMSSPQSPCPYLLLDVRDKECFDKCHIITARSYPSMMLTRSVNPFTRELYEYKNKADSIIIVYDEDETIASDVATKLIQRDFNNVFMLSGGLKVLYKYFPSGIISGSVPVSCYPSPVPTASGRRRSSQSRQKPITGETKDYFTMDDLLTLQQKLDEVLLSSSTSSSGSRSGCSTRATCSRRSSRSLSSSSLNSRPTTTNTQKMWKY